MKLILKQYLASLKERSELDAILPDLLSQMGLNVFVRPMRGTNEYGVDVAAVGTLSDDIEKVYLFSVKAGNLTRSTWSGASDQALRPSLESIIDSYIPHRLPPEHQSKPIAICMCFGGDINTNIRQEVTGYTTKHTNDTLDFEEWNGDKLSELIEKYLLKEELLPKNWQSLLRKSLAILDEPLPSSSHFKTLIKNIADGSNEDAKSIAKSLNSINLCLWILFSWCREDNNLESSYLSAEYSILVSWELSKTFTKNKNVSKAYERLKETYLSITDEYLDRCIIPYADKPHAISHGVFSRCPIDINLRLFDFLSRLSINGIWLLQKLSLLYGETAQEQQDIEQHEAIESRLALIGKTIEELVRNNPLLLSPYSDEQAIDIALAYYLLGQDSNNDAFLTYWIKEIIDRCSFSFGGNGMYVTTNRGYEALLDHKESKRLQNDEYKHKSTNASVLYPLLAVLSELNNCEESSKTLEEFCKESLEHSTLQYWYPGPDSESNFYINSSNHGIATTNFEINGKKAIPHVQHESSQSAYYFELSAVQVGLYPLILTACRHYRYPIPFHIFSDLFQYHQDLTASSTQSNSS